VRSLRFLFLDEAELYAEACRVRTMKIDFHEIVPPTAPGCQLEEAETSVHPRFMGSARTSHGLPY